MWSSNYFRDILPIVASKSNLETQKSLRLVCKKWDIWTKPVMSKKIIVVNDDKIQQYGKTYSWPLIIWNSLTEDVPDETILLNTPTIHVKFPQKLKTFVCNKPINIFNFDILPSTIKNISLQLYDKYKFIGNNMKLDYFNIRIFSEDVAIIPYKYFQNVEYVYVHVHNKISTLLGSKLTNQKHIHTNIYLKEINKLNPYLESLAFLSDNLQHKNLSRFSHLKKLQINCASINLKLLPTSLSKLHITADYLENTLSSEKLINLKSLTLNIRKHQTYKLYIPPKLNSFVARYSSSFIIINEFPTHMKYININKINKLPQKLNKLICSNYSEIYSIFPKDFILYSLKTHVIDYKTIPISVRELHLRRSSLICIDFLTNLEKLRIEGPTQTVNVEELPKSLKLLSIRKNIKIINANTNPSLKIITKRFY